MKIREELLLASDSEQTRKQSAADNSTGDQSQTESQQTVKRGEKDIWIKKRKTLRIQAPDVS